MIETKTKVVNVMININEPCSCTNLLSKYFLMIYQFCVVDVSSVDRWTKEYDIEFKSGGFEEKVIDRLGTIYEELKQKAGIEGMITLYVYHNYTLKECRISCKMLLLRIVYLYLIWMCMYGA